ncbi:hypothetical protein ABT237_15600 [Streptomyces sp. NPDC001581]|uniref:hypothetical protein n=1 Tax=Streptomyces sp. NPDC001581 TaxID=3154386 RepID=UPI00332A33AA
MADLETARAAKRALAARLANDRRVNGVGIGGSGSNYTLKVNIVSADDHPNLPHDIDGVPIEIAVVGNIQAHQ